MRSYYDQIVHIVAFLSLCQLGITKPMIFSMLHTIQKMEHNIRTSYGDSTTTHGGSPWRLPPHSTIQWNEVSPIIWAAISTILLLALNENNSGYRFHAPITNILT